MLYFSQEDPRTGHFMIKMYEDKQRKFKGECMITYSSTEGADGAVKFLNGKPIELHVLYMYCIMCIHVLYMYVICITFVYVTVFGCAWNSCWDSILFLILQHLQY